MYLDITFETFIHKSVSHMSIYRHHSQADDSVLHFCQFEKQLNVFFFYTQMIEIISKYRVFISILHVYNVE